MKLSRIPALSSLLLLAACGGNSSDSNGGSDTPPAASTAITAANAVTVARLSYAAALAAAGIGDLSSNAGLVASAPGGVSKIDGSFATAGTAGGGRASVPIPPTVENCDPSGTTTISGEIADPFTPTLTPDDYFDVSFDMCNDGFSVTDGDLHYRVSAFSGDFLAGSYDLTMAATLHLFQVATAADVLTSNGDATVRLDTLQAPFVTVEVSGAALTTDRNASSETLSGFASTQTVDGGLSPAPYTLESSGTLTSTQLGGTVQYATPVMFEGLDVDYPHSGTLLVTGAGNSSARLTAIDNVNVRIDIDADGDGTFETMLDTTWTALDGG